MLNKAWITTLLCDDVSVLCHGVSLRFLQGSEVGQRDAGLWRSHQDCWFRHVQGEHGRWSDHPHLLWDSGLHRSWGQSVRRCLCVCVRECVLEEGWGHWWQSGRRPAWRSNTGVTQAASFVLRWANNYKLITQIIIFNTIILHLYH